MPWYAAKLVLECLVDARESSLCDEQTRVIDSPDVETAYAAALAIGESEQSEYVNSEGESVTWVFRGLSDLVELSLDSIESGSEVWSTLHENTDLSNWWLRRGD
jgi:hypothetical protein